MVDWQLFWFLRILFIFVLLFLLWFLFSIWTPILLLLSYDPTILVLLRQMPLSCNVRLEKTGTKVTLDIALLKYVMSLELVDPQVGPVVADHRANLALAHRVGTSDMTLQELECPECLVTIITCMGSVIQVDLLDVLRHRDSANFHVVTMLTFYLLWIFLVLDTDHIPTLMLSPDMAITQRFVDPSVTALVTMEQIEIRRVNVTWECLVMQPVVPDVTLKIIIAR